MEPWMVILVALVLVFLAWKFLVGIVKTGVLIGLVVLAGLYAFGVFG